MSRDPERAADDSIEGNMVALPLAAPVRTDPRSGAAAAGDRAAAEVLCRELLPRVRNLVRYLVRGDSHVDDIAQEALIAVLRGLGTYRGDGKFESWVDRIVARTTFAALRRLRAETQPGASDVADRESARWRCASAWEGAMRERSDQELEQMFALDATAGPARPIDDRRARTFVTGALGGAGFPSPASGGGTSGGATGGKALAVKHTNENRNHATIA